MVWHDGFRLPAEFEPHDGTWLLWPVRPDNWRLRGYLAQQDILNLAAHISHYERVHLGAPQEVVETLRHRLPASVEVVAMKYDDIWIRDTGPSVLIDANGNRVAIDWKFNSWGGLFSSSSNDDGVAQCVASHEGLPARRSNLVLEGGAILTDGAGTLIMTEESVLKSNRNPSLQKPEAEQVFRDFLGITNVVWLPNGLANDEAGGHIDNVCVFASSEILLVSATLNEAHPSYSLLRQARGILESARNAVGERFQIVPLPLPDVPGITAEEAVGFAIADGTITRAEGTLMAPSYANLYIINGAVVVPTYGVPTDDAALRIVEECFPERKVVPFHSREFLLGGGAIHCLTKEIPAASEQG